MKRILDDCAANFLTGASNQPQSAEGPQWQPYEEDHQLSNIRLVLSVLSVLLALLAQFYPATYPDNYWVLVFCSSCYFFFERGDAVDGLVLRKGFSSDF